MITITGATGQLGRLIINGLLDKTKATEITAIVRSPEKARDLADLGLMHERFIASGKLEGVSDDIASVTGQPAKGFLPFVREKLKK